jgi:2-polyprenyl-3-methyl-5-hydroxy-6-metoxy-1,4-benzoquinol methylase
VFFEKLPARDKSLAKEALLILSSFIGDYGYLENFNSCVIGMYPEKFRILAIKIIGMLPEKLQNLVFRITTETRYIIFRIKLTRVNSNNTPSPAKIYWISPERIVYHTNYQKKNNNAETIPFWDRVFGKEMRGKVVDGNWDITNYRFTDLAVYKSFRQRIIEGMDWQDTEYCKGILKGVESGRFAYEIRNRHDLDNRCNYNDSLYKSIKNEGYHLSRNVYDKSIAYDEIDVNIGRNGEYLFQNGAHRLSIAKILGLKYVPVRVFVRHKKWQDFRQFVLSYTQNSCHLKRGKLYQPIVHPDLADVPYDLDDHDCEDLIKAISRHLGKKGGTMLDLGANVGFFCHKFEDLGYRCSAIENDPATIQILEKIKIAENKKFVVISKSIFEVKFSKNMKFDVVLALNIFHHFLKRKTEFVKLKELLKNLKMDVLFFEPHLYHEVQMKGGYVNFTPTEFVDFILQNTSLTKSEVIYTAKNGRTVFKLSK